MNAGTPSPWDKFQVWHPRNGIAFAGEQQPLYPQLDFSRFFQTTSREQREDEPAPEPEQGRPADDSDPGRLKPTPNDNVNPTVENSSPSGTNKAEGGQQAKEGEKEVTAEDDGPDDPPFTPLDFKITEEAFRKARLAAPGTPDSFWSYSLYRGPGEDDASDVKVKVHYCRSKHTTERVCKYFLKEKVLGFDLEWAPDATRWQGARRNVSLVQIASERRVALFHLALFPKSDDLVAPSLKKILEDPNITKTGVCIKGDCTRMRNFLDIHARGIFELSHLYKLVKFSSSGQVQLVNKKLVPLAAQVEEHLGLPMFKGHDIRSSDWSQPLRMEQIIYSASDAYAGVQLFAVLNHARESLNPKPPLPHHAELNLPIALADGVTIPTLDETVDVVPAAEDNAKAPKLSAVYLESVRDTIKVETDADLDEPILKETAPKPRKAPSPRPPKDDRVVTADAWTAEYRARNPKARAAASALRAYRIWHSNADLAPAAVAALLRDPPLQTTTVVSYILEAIRLEKLPYEKTRLRTQVLELLPKEVLAGRYRTLLKAASEEDGAAGESK